MQRKLLNRKKKNHDSWKIIVTYTGNIHEKSFQATFLPYKHSQAEKSIYSETKYILCSMCSTANKTQSKKCKIYKNLCEKLK